MWTSLWTKTPPAFVTLSGWCLSVCVCLEWVLWPKNMNILRSCWHLLLSELFSRKVALSYNSIPTTPTPVCSLRTSTIKNKCEMLSIWYLAPSSDSVKGNWWCWSWTSYSHIISLQRCRASALLGCTSSDIRNHLCLPMSLLTCNVEDWLIYVCAL